MAVLMVPLYLHRAQASGKVSYVDIGHRVQAGVSHLPLTTHAKRWCEVEQRNEDIGVHMHGSGFEIENEMRKALYGGGVQYGLPPGAPCQVIHVDRRP